MIQNFTRSPNAAKHASAYAANNGLYRSLSIVRGHARSKKSVLVTLNRFLDDLVPRHPDTEDFRTNTMNPNESRLGVTIENTLQSFYKGWTWTHCHSIQSSRKLLYDKVEHIEGGLTQSAGWASHQSRLLMLEAGPSGIVSHMAVSLSMPVSIEHAPSFS